MSLVSLIVPVFNEDHRLPSLVDEIAPRVGRPLSGNHRLAEVVVVDDGSTDGTPSILRELGQRDRWCVVPSSGGNVGKGDAVKRGVAASTGSIVLFSDVDLAVPLDEAVKLLDQLDRGIALAYGSRDLPGSEVVAPVSRVVAEKLFNLLSEHRRAWTPGTPSAASRR